MRTSLYHPSRADESNFYASMGDQVGKLDRLRSIPYAQVLSLFAGELHALPGKAMAVQRIHEGIGIILFHVEDPFAVPSTGEDKGGADGGRYTGGVGDSL